MKSGDSHHALARTEHLSRNAEGWLLQLRTSRQLEPKTLLSCLVDAIGAIAGLLIATVLLGAIAGFDGQWVFELTVVPAAMMLVFLFAVLGLYSEPGHGPCQALKLRAQAVAVAAGFGALVMSKTNSMPLTIMWAVLAASMMLLIAYFGQWALEQTLAKLGQRGTPAAIIGTGEQARKIASGLLQFPDIGLRPVGFVALPDQSSIGKELPLPLLSRIEHIGTIDQQIRIAVLAMPHRDQTEIERIYGPLPFPHIATIQDMSVLHKLRLQHSGPSSLPMFGRPAARQPGRLAKRTLDLLVSLPLALLTTPLLVLSVIAVKLADPGPALFKQQRIGLNGRPFNVYKIRTMYADAEARLERCLAEDPALAKEWSEHFKLRNDPRVLAHIGKFLRSYSIDELPQLWNVVKGDMSLVGPRPFPLYHVKSFDEDFQHMRSTVMPGLTGLWQITARSDGDLGVQKEQDSLYIENRSFWLDLHILLQTLPAVLSARGAR